MKWPEKRKFTAFYVLFQPNLAYILLIQQSKFVSALDIWQNMTKVEVQWLQRNDLTRLGYDAMYASNILIYLD